MRILIFTLLLTCMLSCKSQKINIAYPVQITKEACKGRCPIYEVKLLKNGELLFNGKKYTEHIGAKTIYLSEKEMDSIQTLYAKVQYENLNKNYDEAVYDFPKTTISDKLHKISYKRKNSAPIQVTDFVDLVVAILNKNKLL